MEKGARDKLLRACYAFLLPVARFLLRAGISFSEFSEVAQSAFVQVASDEFGIRGRATNTSRIAAMTGLSRKAVRAVRERLSRYDEDPRIALSPLGDVLHCWHTTPEFLDANGHPIALPLEGEAGSFEALVNLVASSVPVGAVKVELLRCGAVEECGDGRLRPIRRYTVPDSSSEKLVSSISFNLKGLASNIAHNSEPERSAPGWIERFVYSPYLESSGCDIVREKLREQIAAFTEKVDDEFESVAASHTQPPTTEQEHRRVGVGIYYYEDS